MTKIIIGRKSTVISESELIRMKTGNFRHKLVDIVVIALCVIIIGEDEYEVMEDWALE